MINSDKTKANCLKYIVKNVPISSHLTFFSILGLDFRHQNLDPWKTKSFLLIRNPCDLEFAQYFFCCTLYLVYNKEFPLVYIIGRLHLLNHSLTLVLSKDLVSEVV